jgi:hypothetical protein
MEKAVVRLHLVQCNTRLVNAFRVPIISATEDALNLRRDACGLYD